MLLQLRSLIWTCLRVEGHLLESLYSSSWGHVWSFDGEVGIESWRDRWKEKAMEVHYLCTFWGASSAFLDSLGTGYWDLLVAKSCWSEIESKQNLENEEVLVSHNSMFWLVCVFVFCFRDGCLRILKLFIWKKFKCRHCAQMQSFILLYIKLLGAPLVHGLQGPSTCSRNISYLFRRGIFKYTGGKRTSLTA